MKKILFILCISLFFINITLAESLKVWTIQREPFVINDNNNLTGFSIELWEKIWEKINLDYDFIKYDIFWKMLDDIENNNLDLAISNISITSSREKIMDFSHPIFDWGISLMRKNTKEYNIISYIKSIDNIIIILSILILFLIYKYIKRKKITKQNYYFITSICLFLLVTISISNFTLKKIKINDSLNYNFENLINKNIWVIEKSTSEEYLIQNNIKYKSYKIIENLYLDLKNENINLIMHDFPILQYYVKNNSEYSIVWNTVKKEKYWIAFPEKSKLKEKINLVLLELKANWEYNKIYNKYFWEY